MEYQNCLLHSLMFWNRNREYNIFHDGNHVFACKETCIKSAVELTTEPISFYRCFDVYEMAEHLLIEYFNHKKRVDNFTGNKQLPP